MQWIGGAWFEIESLVESPGFIIFGMNEEGASTDDGSGSGSAYERVLEERRTDALFVDRSVYGKTRK